PHRDRFHERSRGTRGREGRPRLSRQRCPDGSRPARRAWRAQRRPAPHHGAAAELAPDNWEYDCVGWVERSETHQIESSPVGFARALPTLLLQRTIAEPARDTVAATKRLSRQS